MSRSPKHSSLGGEIVPLRDARRALGRGAVVRDGALRGRPPSRAGARAPRRAGSARRCARSASSASSSSSPAAGPSHHRRGDRAVERRPSDCPTCRSSSPYSARICGQSVSSARAASSCTAAIAACSWYGPTDPCAQRSRDERDAFGDQRAGPSSVRSCSSSGISSPLGPVRAARRASVSSISASRPATSPSSGSRCVHGARQPDRLVGEIGALQIAGRCCSCSPR